MPTHEYKCQSCNHSFEKLQKMSDKPIAVCPRCDGDVVRLIGAGCAVHFKGTGFPGNDLRKNRR